MSGPIRGEAYEFFIPLLDLGTGEFLLTPTISPGDFRVSKDGADFADLATTPVVMPSAMGSVKVDLSALEMTADKVVVEGIDVTVNQEWRSVFTFLDVEVHGSDVDVKKILDILEGDHIERSDRVIINRKNTEVALLDKKIFGSLLKSNVVIRTTEQP